LLKFIRQSYLLLLNGYKNVAEPKMTNSIFGEEVGGNKNVEMIFEATFLSRVTGKVYTGPPRS